MPIVLADANLPAITTEGFFNELEEDVLAEVNSNGSGHYKLTHLKNNGNFIAAELVIEADDDAVLSEYGDRFTQEGADEDYMYVNFVV